MSHPAPQPNSGTVHMTLGVDAYWIVSWQSDRGDQTGYLPGPEGLDFDQALAWARSQPAARIIIHNEP